MDYKRQFEELKDIYKIPESSGYTDTYLSNVKIFHSTQAVERAPLLFHAGIIIIGQGYKVGYLNGREFKYDENNYLISSVPTTFECETYACKDNPVVGLHIDIDVFQLSQLIEKVEKHKPENYFKKSDVFHGVEPASITQEIRVITERLLNCLKSPLEAEVLGQAMVEELLFHALLGDHGNALVALTQKDSHYAKIANVIQYIHLNHMNELTVEDMARKANMSPSSFFRAFKLVTGESPLQYLKKVRLTQARFLIVREKVQIGVAANKVGYQSFSQFSREFKRYFKTSPSAAHEGAYSEIYE